MATSVNRSSRLSAKSWASSRISNGKRSGDARGQIRKRRLLCISSLLLSLPLLFCTEWYACVLHFYVFLQQTHETGDIILAHCATSSPLPLPPIQTLLLDLDEIVCGQRIAAGDRPRLLSARCAMRSCAQEERSQMVAITDCSTAPETAAQSRREKHECVTHTERNYL